MSIPSVKKGLNSSNLTSYGVRLLTTLSETTCPKSGMIVASRVKLSLRPYFTSIPPLPNHSERKPFDLAEGSLRKPVETYGEKLKRSGGFISTRLLNKPNWLTKPLACGSTWFQKLVSLFRRTDRI